jgi:hypothetical protein
MKNTTHFAILKRGKVFTTACLRHFYAFVSLEINDLPMKKIIERVESAKSG